MNTAEKEARVWISHEGKRHLLPKAERGCDGCQYQGTKSILLEPTPVFKGRELDHLEESFNDTTWCWLFAEQVEGGPCDICIDKRTKR